MSQLRQFLIGKTKYLHNHGQSIRYHDAATLVRQLPNSMNIRKHNYTVHAYKRKISSNSTNNIFNESELEKNSINLKNVIPMQSYQHHINKIFMDFCAKIFQFLKN